MSNLRQSRRFRRCAGILLCRCAAERRSTSREKGREDGKCPTICDEAPARANQARSEAEKGGAKSGAEELGRASERRRSFRIALEEQRPSGCKRRQSGARLPPARPISRRRKDRAA